MFIWTTRTARKRHRCRMCRRVILPGEPYERMAGLDGGQAWTYKFCTHCTYCTNAYPDSEWDEEWVVEWLEDAFPITYVSLCAGWRYPDGELLPFPTLNL